jgi:L-asparaginase II
MIQILPMQKFKKQHGIVASEQELACGCASHAGEACHTEVISKWLQRLSLDEKALVCGAHLPFDDRAAKELIRNNQTPSKIHNNCSGKHAGLLEWAQLLGAPTSSYFEVSHPVQKSLRQEMENLGDYKFADDDWGIDGCGIPAWQMPLKNMALMLARFSNEAAKPGTAEELIFNACVKNPVLTSGTDEFCGQAMQRMPGEVFFKVGAEGVMTAILPKKQVVIALKVHDGAERATEVAVASILTKAFPEMQAALSAWTAPTLYNWAGTPIGTISAE